MRKLICTAFAVFMTLALMAVAYGQSSTLSNVTGVVNDPSGATVSGANVKITNKATGEEKSTTTTDSGEFTFTQLAPGQYSIVVEAANFKKALAPNISVEVGKPARVTIALEVGSVAETVTVSAAQEIINTLTPALTTVISTRQVQDLPLPTRNPLDLAGLPFGPGGHDGLVEQVCCHVRVMAPARYEQPQADVVLLDEGGNGFL